MIKLDSSQEKDKLCAGENKNDEKVVRGQALQIA